MKLKLLTMVPLACVMIPAFAGSDPFLEYNCMGQSAPSAEAPVLSAAATNPIKPVVAAVLKKEAAGVQDIADNNLTGTPKTVVIADRGALKVKASCASIDGKC